MSFENGFDRRTRDAPSSRNRRWALLLLLAVAAPAACDDDALLPPEPEAPIFARYVALGNSITAGFESGGINDSTQMNSWAVQVADAMGTPFGVPLLSAPGCPPPIVNVFTGERVAGGTASDCALRERPIPEVLNNAAVPGAAVIDAFTNLDPEASPNPLTTLLLGGRTQVQVARRVQPTFASVWLGNDDVLGPALAGDPSGVTDPSTFADRYAAVLDSLEGTAPDGSGLTGVLVGVADVTAIPLLSPGAAYWEAQQQGAFPPTFDVADNCAPEAFGGVGETTLVPFGYGFGELLARAAEGETVTLDCVADPPVLTATEIGQIRLTVQAYNQAISTEADARDWAYFDPNPALDSLRTAGEVPLFPNITGPDAVARPFGDFFSKDGVHPNRAMHLLIANHVIEAINARYETQIAPVGG